MKQTAMQLMTAETTVQVLHAFSCRRYELIRNWIISHQLVNTEDRISGTKFWAMRLQQANDATLQLGFADWRNQEND